MESQCDFGTVKVCIFDVNGVLIDSNRSNALAMGESFSSDPGLRDRIADFYLTLTGIDRGTKIRTIQDEVIGRPFREGEFEERWENFKKFGVSAMLSAPLGKGCREVLACLGKRKITRAALSNTPERELLRILAAKGLDPSLDLVRGGGDWPKSESLTRFLAEFNFDPAECIFLGDGKGDLAAARHAGVRFFGIDPGTGEFAGREGVCGPFRNLAEWADSVLAAGWERE